MPSVLELPFFWTLVLIILVLLLFASLYLFWFEFLRKGARSIDDNLRAAFVAERHPEAFISFQQLAAIEEHLPGLIAVVVIANELDDPSREKYKVIYNAMKDNFMEGVQYNFLISPSQYDKRSTLFLDYFGAIFRQATLEAPPAGPKSVIRAQQLSFETLCRIFRLRREWTSFPYIFYRRRSGEDQPLTTIAYRGVDIQHGLSTRYCEVPSQDAVTILHVCQMMLAQNVFDQVVPRPDELVSASVVLPS